VVSHVIRTGKLTLKSVNELMDIGMGIRLHWYYSVEHEWLL